TIWMCEAVDPVGRLNTRIWTAISSFVGSMATSAVATAPLRIGVGVSSPPLSVARRMALVWADAAAACTSVALAASRQIDRIFRITVVSLMWGVSSRRPDAEHEADHAKSA